MFESLKIRYYCDQEGLAFDEIPNATFFYNSYDKHYNLNKAISVNKEGWIDLNNIIDDVGEISEKGMTLKPLSFGVILKFNIHKP